MKTCIIGAGFSGLAAARALKTSNLEFDVLEADDDVGGNWYHGVYPTAHIISSRDTTQYPDFPMPRSYPDFPSASQMLEYFRSFADHYALWEHIQFETRVTRVSPRSDGTWTVEVEGQAPRVYGSVIVANGHHWKRRFPTFDGHFTGETMHSRDYKGPEALAGKRVLVVGGGNSACDIAVEAARFAASSQISMRRGYWFLPKTLLGVPTVELLKPWLPVFLQRLVLQVLLRIAVGPYESYGLTRPDHRIFEAHPTINSQLLYSLRHGRITPRGDVSRFEGRDVIFADGSRQTFDLIVFATGYDVSFPFLDEGVVGWNRGMPELIEGVLPVLQKNIYFFGLGQPRYGAGPLLSAGADVLVSMMRAQDKMEAPLGAVLSKVGSRSRRTWLIDPHATLRRAWWAKRMLPLVPRIAPWLTAPASVAPRSIT